MATQPPGPGVQRLLRCPRTVRALLASVAVLAGSGCSSGSATGTANDSPSVTASSSASGPTPTPRGAGPTATSKAEALRTAYPHAGFTVTSLPRRIPAATLEVLRSYLAFEVATRTSFRTATVPASLSRLATPDLVSRYRGSAEYMRDNNVRFRGTTTMAVSVDRTSSRLAVLDVCLDGSGTQQIVEGETRSLDGLTREKMRVVLVNPQSRWTVSEYTATGTTC